MQHGGRPRQYLLIGEVTVKDPIAYEQYRSELGDLIARHHGVVRGGEIEVVAGDWRPNRLIILRFPVKTYLNALSRFGLLRRQQALLNGAEVAVVQG